MTSKNLGNSNPSNQPENSPVNSISLPDNEPPENSNEPRMFDLFPFAAPSNPPQNSPANSISLPENEQPENPNGPGMFDLFPPSNPPENSILGLENQPTHQVIDEIPSYSAAQRLGVACSFFGCDVRLTDERSNFCCVQHGEISRRVSMGKYAYVVVDSFIAKEKEHNIKTIIPLLDKTSGINVGIPTVDKEKTIDKVPWEWDLPGEKNRSWLFFHPISQPKVDTFMFTGVRLMWCRKSNRRHVYSGFQIASSVSYLTERPCKKFPKLGTVDSIIKGWTLTEHYAEDKNLSLFCLTYAGEETSLLNTHMGRGPAVKRKQCEEAATEKGLIRRYLEIVLDFSGAAAETDFRPSRMAVMAKHVEPFIREFFDQNPQSQIGLVFMKNGAAHTLTELGGSPEPHINVLMRDLEPSGDYSLQNALEHVHDHLDQVPSYGHREVLLLCSALSTSDPGNILETIKKCKKSKLRCSGIGLSAEMYLCQETGGSYDVAEHEVHLRDLLLKHVPPPTQPEEAKKQ